MNKIIALALTIFLTSSVFGSSTCCSSQGGCGNQKSCQTKNDQKIIAEMMNLELNSMQRDKLRAMLMRHKMERKNSWSQLRENMYNVLTPEQKQELSKRLKTTI
ncbi:hypothetical protein [Sulfurimonas marina]|uniref:DUF1104 domain-containing protein n=1 Tax=Sulfurimonas marina TaxID=2590551 RepID=A0A7M1AWC5_9BACT|nr:hypothetical protein [Sulfurimonas marina]QOP40898.1 hypothetical protein FJR03_03740 [Sulfurimonas marina]